MIRSMTGHGAGEAPLAAGTVRVELRAVNHRHLDARVRVPDALAEGAMLVEDLVRAGCVRGRIEGQVRLETSASGGRIDLNRARSVYQSLSSLRDELAPGTALPIDTVLRAPGVFESAAALPGEEVTEALRVATERAVQDLAAMRAREGEALARDLSERLALLREGASWVETRRPEVVENHRQRLKKRIDTLLAGSEIALDPARLAQEVALFADRSDVAEELTRLASHIEQFSQLLKQDDASTSGAGSPTAAQSPLAVGRKLDFLVQELGREINTIGSKANDAGITHRVVEMKAELERVREQVQNVL